MTVAITVEDNQIRVVGSGFGDGGKLDLEVLEVAAPRSDTETGDTRSARYRTSVAHAFKDMLPPPDRCDDCGKLQEAHGYPAGEVDWDEPLMFGTGTVSVTVRDAGEVVGEEVFHLG